MLSIQKISYRGFLTVLALAVIMAGFAYLLTFLKTEFAIKYYYLIYVFVFGFLLAIVALLIGKAVSLMLFAFIAGLLIYPNPLLTNSGLAEIAILVFAAFVFELLAVLLKRGLLGLIFATVVSVATIPFTMLLLVGQFYETMLKSTINFSILCAILGLFAALLAIGVWECVKTKKFIINLRILS